MKSIKSAFDKNVSKLSKTFLSKPWDEKAFYAHYLAQTYYYIIHSTKLLKFAAEHSKNEELTQCFQHHVSEETGHELWALGDLKRLGFNIKDFPESDYTKALYGQIYKGIESEGPAAIVGYAMVLEGMSAVVCPQLGPILIKNYGAQSSVFIKSHGEIDQGHSEESFKILKYFSDEEKKTIVRYMDLSTKAYSTFLDEISRVPRRQTA